jgi:hypothetical protein
MGSSLTSHGGGEGRIPPDPKMLAEKNKQLHQDLEAAKHKIRQQIEGYEQYRTEAKAEIAGLHDKANKANGMLQAQIAAHPKDIQLAIKAAEFEWKQRETHLEEALDVAKTALELLQSKSEEDRAALAKKHLDLEKALSDAVSNHSNEQIRLTAELLKFQVCAQQGAWHFQRCE